VNTTESTTLQELGERRIIEEILRPRYANESPEDFGHDCAIIGDTDEWPGRIVVATTDPCPEPVASLLGYKDLYYRGWLLATINLSDLAATGATPKGLLTSLILPNDLSIDDLNRLLDGIDDCSMANEARVLGGNIKEGARIDLTATAIGICIKGKALSRRGCRPGDLIVVVGDLGLFWAGVLAVQKQVPLGDYGSELLRNVLTPSPKVKVGQAIANKALFTACIDNSDGLYPSLVQLAETNQCQMRISFENVSFHPAVLYVSSLTSISPTRYSLGWGDWQLIGCCSPEKLDVVLALARDCNTAASVIGEVRTGRGVVLADAGEVKPMAPIDSQRFTKDSWFTLGLDSYIEVLTKGPLWISGDDDRQQTSSVE
jgi:thiamine-monophosphate kinase